MRMRRREFLGRVGALPIIGGVLASLTPAKAAAATVAPQGGARMFLMKKIHLARGPWPRWHESHSADGPSVRAVTTSMVERMVRQLRDDGIPDERWCLGVHINAGKVHCFGEDLLSDASIRIKGAVGVVAHDADWPIVLFPEEGPPPEVDAVWYQMANDTRHQLTGLAGHELIGKPNQEWQDEMLAFVMATKVCQESSEQLAREDLAFSFGRRQINGWNLQEESPVWERFTKIAWTRIRKVASMQFDYTNEAWNDIASPTPLHDFGRARMLGQIYSTYL